MDVRLPDGTIIKNVPDGTTKADLVKKLQGNGMAVPSEWLADSAPKQSGPATDRQRLLSSAPMRLAKGMKDPIDGSAQLLQRVLPEGVVNAVNKVADAVGGEGTFLGDVLGIKGMTPAQLDADINGSEQEYQEARQATAAPTLSSLVTGQKDPGFDAMRLTGNVLSPVNAAVSRLVPLPSAGAPTRALVTRGAAGGAAGAATQPVMGDNFAGEKLLQVGTGAAAGGVLTPVLSRAAEAAARYVRARAQTGRVPPPEVIKNEIRASFARDDIDLAQIPRHVMDDLTRSTQEAMASGQQVDAAALLRRMDFERLGMQPLRGQITRDPTQFARERDLRGIQGVGEPIANRLNEQAAQLSSRFRRNTAGAQTPYDAGDSLIGQLQRWDRSSSGQVRSAYDAFRESTGRELPVPMQPLRSGYREVLTEFDDHIPSAVRKKFEEIVNPPRPAHSHGAKAPEPKPLQILGAEGQVLSDLTPKPQPKNLSIEEAERLIKTINNNYDPANKPQALALDKLRKHVQDSIIGATESGEGMEAATLGNFARSSARDRFQAIDNTPALKAAINDAAPDDFVKKYVINGKVREINRLAELVGPQGQQTMRQQLLRHLEQRAFGANAAGDGAGSQASFNRELESIGRNKLMAVLGPQTTDELYAIGRVMAYIQQQPAGSAVNNSNTGAAVANLFSRIGGKLSGAPYINDFVVKPLQAARERGEVQNALSAALRQQATELEPETVNALSRLIRPAPVAAGAALGYSVR